MEIRKYDPHIDFEQIMEIIKSEGEEWACYAGRNREKYEKSLQKSIVYVAYSSDVLCGYARSIDDGGFDIYVYDLLVHEDFRGNSIGKLLFEHLKKDYPNQSIYVLSDVDGYYQKLGYKKIGSIFEV